VKDPSCLKLIEGNGRHICKRFIHRNQGLVERTGGNESCKTVKRHRVVDGKTA
jgi:hypothetical protein